AARIADEAGAAAHEDDGPVAGQLDAAQGQQRQETADVQAVGGGIEAHVGRTAPGGQVRVELVGGRDIRDQLAALEIAQQLLAHIPQTLRDAVIATEDRRFYSHFGVDPIGVARAVYQNYRRGRIVEGGSTITQQLTKVLFLTPDKSLERKMKEAALALELERR